MSDFLIIRDKLEQFIRRFYGNELLKGSIMFVAIGLLYFIFTLLVEYILWLEPIARTVLFWTFVVVELVLLGKFIVFPLMKLFKLQKGIGHEEASKIIGNHFPEVNDKLLNVLQLAQDKTKSELLLASIDQKAIELKPIPFKLAISLKKSLKYIKFAAIPCLVFLISFLTGKTEWFRDSYKRVVHYRMVYEPPAPFQFFISNGDLNAIENKDFKLNIKTAGDVIPGNAQIHYNDQTFFLQQIAPGEFEYIFNQPQNDIKFHLSANTVNSRTYSLNVTKTPILLNFVMDLDYPPYLNKENESFKSTGSATVPEGTVVTWNAITKSTDYVSIYADDTLNFEIKGQNKFEAKKQIHSKYDYTISTGNSALKDYENLSFSVRVIKDEYPELNVEAEKDSVDNQTLYFWGQVSDDYGINRLQLVYYPSGEEEKKTHIDIPISNSNFDEFIIDFPNNLDLLEGVGYELYFQVFDNDALHNFKSVKSNLFSFRKLTNDEIESIRLNEQNETIKDLGKTQEKLREQDKQLEELSKIQKEKQELNFNDKKKFESFLKRQKQQEELMMNFNQKLRENIENTGEKNERNDLFKEDLMERIKENEDQIKQDEKLLEELEKLKEKIQKEEFAEKLEELAKQSKNKQRGLKQLLELTKRYYVAKKAEKLQQQLEELSKEQNNLSEEKKENNTKEEQEKLNESFKGLQEEIEQLQKDNKALQKPLEIPRDKLTEEEIKKEQKEAFDNLNKREENDKNGNQNDSEKNKSEAIKKQKSAADKIKKLSESMKMPMSMSGMEQLSEDAEMLRQILDNLVLFSFDQENLMNTFKNIDINNNKYSKLMRKQNSLREHFEHIDDSLFALSLRQPKISEKINGQITEVFFNIDNSLTQLSENQIYQGISSQQYTLTATNVLASFLSDILDNIEAQMSKMLGLGRGNQDIQLPDIIMSQEELNKKMEDGLKKEGMDNNGKPEEQGNDNPNGKRSGSEGADQEELNGELYEIYQEQQRIKNALKDKLDRLGENGDNGKILKDMEEIELDLINKGFTNRTLEKMNDLHYQLLKLENAAFTQGIDNKRQSETNFIEFINDANEPRLFRKEYFNAIEILNRQSLPMKEAYKSKVQKYFKKIND